MQLHNSIATPVPDYLTLQILHILRHSQEESRDDVLRLVTKTRADDLN